MTRAATNIVAKRKDLHEGRSLWSDSAQRKVRARQARLNETFEVVIVGGGISGALCALVLSAAGHEVAVVDRRPPGEGSTIASTAMIQFEIDTPLINLADQIGQKAASRAYLRSAKAVRDLRDLISEHNLNAHWTDRDALFLAGNEMGYRGLMKEAEARQKLGLQSTFLSKADVLRSFGIETTGAILSAGSAELDPARLSASCLRKAQNLGATVISPCEITTVESDANKVRLSTKAGGMISAHKVIFATGYEVIRGIPRDAFEIVSSWAIATKPIGPEKFWPSRCLIWEAADPYMYLRSTRDNRILVGGEDSGLTNADRRAAAIPAKANRLLRKAQQLLHLPELEIDYAWAGAFADSPTGLPVFKTLPDLPNVFAILGCGGNGITFSMIASDVVESWLAGRKDPDYDLFAGL